MKIGFALYVGAENNVGASHDDAVRIDVFGEHHVDRQPLVTTANDEQFFAVVMGRLHYRDDVLAHVGPLASVDSTDAELAIAAVKRFGIRGLEHLEGDFAAVVLDRKLNRIHASRDPMGGFPLFWCRRDNRFAISNGLQPLVKFRGDDDIDMEYFGEFQTLRFSEVDYQPRTPYSRIQRLVPGTRLMIDIDRQAVSISEYWNWQERMTRPRSTNIDDLAEQYRDLLTQAVAQRLHGTVAAHCSGGMDSTAISILASRSLGRTRPMHALSLVYESLANLEQETSYLEDGLREPGIVSHRLSGDQLLDYDVFRDAPLHDEPYSGLFRVGAFRELTELAHRVGADTVLTGMGADEVLANAPFYIADLVRRRKLSKAWNESLKWSRAHRCGIWKFIKPYGIDPLLPGIFHVGARAAIRGGFASWDHHRRWSIPPWIRRDFARRGRIKSKIIETLHREFRQSRSVVNSVAMARIQFATGDWIRSAIAAPLGMVVSHPFRDSRVMAFGLGTRRSVDPVPRMQKVLLNKAMQDVLPQRIRSRRSKTNYNSVYYAGLSRNQSYLEQMILRSDASGLGLFQVDSLLECLNKAALGVGNLDATASLNCSLAIVKWFDQRTEWRAQPCRPRVSMSVGKDGSLVSLHQASTPEKRRETPAPIMLGDSRFLPPIGVST